MEVNINKDIEVNVDEDINLLIGVGEEDEDSRHEVHIFKKTQLNKNIIELCIEMVFEDMVTMRFTIKLYALDIVEILSLRGTKKLGLKYFVTMRAVSGTCLPRNNLKLHCLLFTETIVRSFKHVEGIVG